MSERLIVDRKTRKLFAAIDPADGTLYALTVHAEYSPRQGNDEVAIFTDREIAERFVAAERLNARAKLEVVQVEIFRVEAANTTPP